MVVTGEVLGELETCELVVGHDTVDDPGSLEQRQVAIHRRLGETVGPVEHLGDGERTVGCGEQLDEFASARRVALVIIAETNPDGVVQVSGGHGHGVMLASGGRRTPGPTGVPTGRRRDARRATVRLPAVTAPTWVEPPDISTPDPPYPTARRPDRSRWVVTDGLHIATYEWGDPDAPVIFMAHGGFDFAATFDLLAPRLADAGWRCVSWDARGHGSSEHAHLYSWTADERDAMAVLDTITDEPVVFLGHSKGGGMMLDMAHAAPHRLSHLVNLDGLPSRNAWPDVAGRERTAMVHAALTDWLDHHRSTATARRHPGTIAELAVRRARMNPRLDPAWLEYIVPIGATEDADGWRWNIDPTLRLGGFGPWRPEWAMEHLPGVGVPVLGVLALETEVMGWGTTPADVLDNLPPGGRYVGLDGVGHFVHIEAPDRVAEVVLDFLGDPPAHGGGRSASGAVAPGRVPVAPGERSSPHRPASPPVDTADGGGAPVVLTHGHCELVLHHLRSATDPDTHPLLLLHGLGEHTDGVPTSVSSWTGDIWGLDFTGHGRSALPAGGGYTAELLLGDVDAALAHLGPTTVVGRGLGAYVALMAAGGRPEVVRGVVLTDGPGLVGGGIRPSSPTLPTLERTEWSTPDPLALWELSRDVRPPDYAVEFVRLALEWSGLDTPVSVCTRVRPEWLDTVVAHPGVLDTTVARALEGYSHAARR